MKVALVNTWSRRAGGIENHLAMLIPALRARGLDARLWYERNAPEERPSIVEAGVSSRLCYPQHDLDTWAPDVVYVHSVEEPRVEERLVSVAPAVLFLHQHRGTCISGEKTFKTPTARPCHRQFGWPCLLHYYPRRCGGLNPSTMVRDYRRQRARFELLAHYRAFVTHSNYMEDEYARHGVARDRIYRLPFPIRQPSSRQRKTRARRDPLPWRLLFLGRMDRLKGGDVLLKALPQVVSALDHAVHVVFVGDGPSRTRWQEEARRTLRSTPALSIEFVGWKDEQAVDLLYAGADLVVNPSLQPESFGMVGPEAGRHGVPAAAFDVGGITEWLIDGVNGATAEGNPPTAHGLAAAIVRCLVDPQVHARLGRGAEEVSLRFALDDHVRRLLEVLERVCK